MSKDKKDLTYEQNFDKLYADMIYYEEQAKMGLMDEGVTCENFETVCDMAGVNSNKTRSFAYKVINTKNNKYLRNRIRSVLRGEDE